MTIDPPPETLAVYVGREALGDSLMKLPFLRALRGAFPDVHITWVVGVEKTAFAHELAPLTTGLINEIIEEAGFKDSLSLFLRRPLAGRRFDLVIDTQLRVKRSLLVRRLRHRVFVSGAANYLLSSRWPASWKLPPSEIDRLMKLVGIAYGGLPPTGPNFVIEPALEARAAECLPPGAVYVGFAPGAGGQHKRWPLDRFLDLARAQVRAGRVPVILLGPGEAGLAVEVQKSVPGAIIPEEAPGTGFVRSPILSIAIALRLAAAVANDSGVGHLLAAGESPLVSLFGPTSSVKFRPGTPRLRIVRAQDFGSDEMSAIPQTAVSAALDQLLD